ncbi:MAG: PP2C family protein-serine/threonine phosphatase [Thermoanaerobaculia bacterium]
MPTDWKTLAKETVHSFDADEVRGMWDVDFRRATRVFPADHEDEIARERRRWTVGGDLYAFPLGIKKNVEYVPVTTTLASSEVLLFHSDGLSEARGANGEEFGDARIEHLLFRRAGARPHEVVSALAADLDLFLGRVAAEDDVSIAAVRRKSA